MDGHEPPLTRKITFSAGETAGIEEARAQVNAGLVVNFADSEAWLDGKNAARPLPVPQNLKV